jgi:hypothetical protein
MDRFDPRECEKRDVPEALFVPDTPHDGAALPAGDVRAESQCFDALADLVELLVRHPDAGHDDHSGRSLGVVKAAILGTEGTRA